MKRIGMGLVGPGFVGAHHIDAVRRLGFVDVVAVAASSEASARRKADALGVPKAYGSVEALVADPDVHVVHNTTPNYLHVPVILAALERGKHVISDKPLATTAADARLLLDAANKAGVVHAVTFNYRGNPLVQQAREMIAGGELGPVHFIHGAYLQDWLLETTDFSWRLEPEKGGASSAVGDIGSHWCDLVQHVSGQRIVEVLADLTTVIDTRLKPSASTEAFAKSGDVPREAVRIHSEDLATILLRFDDGAKGSVSVGQVCAGHKNGLWIELNGRRASVRWEQERQNELWIGRRDAANAVLARDPSLLLPGARAYTHLPGRPSGRLGRRVLQRHARRLRIHRRRQASRRSASAGLCHLRRRLPVRVRRRRDTREPPQTARCGPAVSQTVAASMKLGVFTPVFGAMALDEVLGKVRSLPHVTALEIGTGGWPGSAHLDIDALLDKKSCAAEYRKKIADAGLTISALSCHANPLHPDAATARAADDLFRKTVRLAGQLDVPVVVTFSGCPGDAEGATHPNWVTTPWPPEFLDILEWQWEKKAIPYWCGAAHFANEHGVRIALEAHPGFIVYNVDSAMRLRQAVGPNLGVNFDPSHFFWQGVDVPAAIRALGDAIFHVHAKDVAIDPRNVAINGVIDTKTYRRMAERSWLFRSVGWGHDELEWKRIVSALRLAGYDYVMSIEHEDALASVDEGLRAAVDLLSRVILTEPPVQAWWT